MNTTESVEAQYLAWLSLAGLRPKTVTESTHAVEKWLRETDGKPFSVQTLNEFRDYVGAQSWSPRYKNLILAQVKAMLNWARKRELIELSGDKITDTLSRFKEDRSAPVVLTTKELRRLATACAGYPATGRTVLAVMLTGARHAEIKGLRQADIDEHGIHITASRSKNHQGRVIPRFIIGGRCMRLITRHGAFVWKRSEWEAIRKAAHLDVKVKALRSTWATYAVSRGLLNPWQVAKVCGHTLQVAEKAYFGAAIFGLEGDTVDHWLGISDLLKPWTGTKQPEEPEEPEVLPPVAEMYPSFMQQE